MDEHVLEVASHVSSSVLNGDLIWVLGAGVNLCGRPSGSGWRDTGAGRFLPDAGELGAYLADINGPVFRGREHRLRDLARVSQYTMLALGSRDLYDSLHKIFDADYGPTAVHVFLASLPSLLRSRARENWGQLLVTTNYDDVLEKAFRARGEEFDLVTYIAQTKDENSGKFYHLKPTGERCVIQDPNEYTDLPEAHSGSLIVKMHGTVRRGAPESDLDQYVITEDDYVDYLTRADVSQLFPVTLAARLKNSHLLFLGYGLRDWNVRVMLNRLWKQSKLVKNSWAVYPNPDRTDRAFWGSKGVEIVDAKLEDFIPQLSSQLDARLKALPATAS